MFIEYLPGLGTKLSTVEMKNTATQSRGHVRLAIHGVSGGHGQSSLPEEMTRECRGDKGKLLV